MLLNMIPILNWVKPILFVLSSVYRKFELYASGILNKELENLLSVSNAMEHYITHQLDFGIHSHRRIINERLLQFQTLISKAQEQLQSLR